MLDAMHLDALDGIVFLTNVDGAIDAVGPTQWNMFASANGAPELTDRSVIGKSLFDFIAGKEVQAQLSRVMEKIAAGTYRAWVMPFRCDSPDRERNMRQSITPVLSQGRCSGFVFQSVELETHQRPPMDLFNFRELERRASKESGLPMVKLCSWCQRVQCRALSPDNWLKAEDYYAKGGRSNVMITHGICEPCADAVTRSFKM